jgi:ABC-type multidrug transport system ATPase subunit
VSDPEALRARKLVKRYGDTVALGPLDLQVRAGELVALLGPNGAGKSTLLALAAGLLEPSEGKLHVFGERPGSLAARRLVSYVPDTPALYDDLGIAETAEYVARLAGAPDWEERVDTLLDHFGLTERADQPPGQLSRGLRQRAALVVGLARPCRLLLLDEPFATLDAESVDLLASHLRERAAGGAAVVLSSHQHDALPADCRALRLREGRIDREDPLGDTLGRPS